jgi:hypothetical protein
VYNLTKAKILFLLIYIREGSTCLTSKRPNVTDILEVVNSTLDLPGQDYTPDDQCRMIWGPTSYLCRVCYQL